jgi:hypothetical protein
MQHKQKNIFNLKVPTLSPKIPTLYPIKVISIRITGFNDIVYYTTYEGHFHLLKFNLLYLETVFSYQSFFHAISKTRHRYFAAEYSKSIHPVFVVA